MLDLRTNVSLNISSFPSLDIILRTHKNHVYCKTRKKKSVCWSITLESCQSKSMQRPSNPRCSTLISISPSYDICVLCKPSYHLENVNLHLFDVVLLPFSRSYATTLNDGWQLCVYLTACHLLLVQEYLCLYLSHQIIFYSLFFWLRSPCRRLAIIDSRYIL